MALLENAAEQQVGEDKEEATESLVYATFLLAAVAPGEGGGERADVPALPAREHVDFPV